ncbi:hypothetical protein [Flavilitoribacter nigricans]|uniref:Uncharacterized protein n=1 Tax=Flavilitoribacter nigricans (strain ATCC 23147 / DSM 23189 / NBRC 102662 / NCIMB 1420 / SS-2) TaxID=1122177 RepID=A0A2D0NF34_FLAN2|nr:hypothetical protein [Flavilitoribacter nigricans]PHN07121.1 hypothetical protein CRP01_07790 [Flavilitoribacter nigricans DSM 23189 = NBRC 102662]
MRKSLRRNLQSLLTVLGILVTGSMAYLTVILYRRTFIAVQDLILMMLGIGLVATFFILRSKYFRKTDLLLSFLVATVGIGSLFTGLFLAANTYLGDPPARSQSRNIIRKDSRRGPKGRRNETHPTVYIRYNGLEKELVYPHDSTEAVEQAVRVELVVKTGLLGYEFITGKRLQ